MKGPFRFRGGLPLGYQEESGWPLLVATSVPIRLSLASSNFHYEFSIESASIPQQVFKCSLASL